MCLNSPQFEVFKNEPCGPSSPKNCQNGTRSGSHPNSSSQKAPMHNSLVQITTQKPIFCYFQEKYFILIAWDHDRSLLNGFLFLLWAFIAPVTSTQILATESLQTRRRPHYHPKIFHLPKIHLFQWMGTETIPPGVALSFHQKEILILYQHVIRRMIEHVIGPMIRSDHVIS